MTDLIERIAAAIIRQEGMSPGHVNPGNLRDCPWFAGQPPLRAYDSIELVPQIISRRKYPDGSPVVYQWRGSSGIFWVPGSRAEGEAAIRHCLWLRTAERESLRTALYAWAPPGDGNDSAAYVDNVKGWAGITDENAPLLSLLEEIT